MPAPEARRHQPQRRVEDRQEAEDDVRQPAGRRGARVTTPVVTQDERLTSVEAESLLARREKDWRRRKEKLDAAAAAVILQEYLDRWQGGADAW